MELQIPSVPLFLTFFLFILTTWRIRKKLENNNQLMTPPNPPPGPWKLPFIGNLHQVVGASLPHQLITELAKKYGGVMRLQLGEVPAIVISSPQAAKEAMKTHDINFSNKPHFLATDIIFYDNQDIFFAPHGDTWRLLRKVSILKLLSAKRVLSFQSIREEEVSKFIKTISSKEGVPINLSEMIDSLLKGITARTSIGKKFKNKEAFLAVIGEIIPIALGLFMADMYPSSKFFLLNCWTKFKIRRVHQKADKLLDDIINERRARIKEAKTSENESEDMLTALLNHQQHGNSELSLTTQEIKAMMVEMFVAGSETTLTILEWAMAEMVKNPRVMEKVQREVREVFSDMKTNDETRLHELKYLKLIIKETLRLHPAGAFIIRECREACKIQGYDIPAKGKFMINGWAMGRDPGYWNEPEKFLPERFIDSSVDYKGAHFELIPFGAGRRMCPGIFLGMRLVELILAQLLNHFDWRLPSGVKNEDLDMSESVSSTVRRKHALYLIPKPCYPSTV